MIALPSPRLAASVAAAAFLASCTARANDAFPAPQPQAAASRSAVTAAARKTFGVRFFVVVPSRNDASRYARPSFIPAHAASIVITLARVDGAAPQAGTKTAAATNLTHCAGGCTVFGPSAPAGNDEFELAIFDAANGKGNALATGSAAIAVAPGRNTTGSATMQGVPSSVASIGSVPTGTGGTAFGAPAPLAVRVADADGDTIGGRYASPVIVGDADPLSATLASGLTLDGSCTSPSKTVTLASSTDAADLALCYGGMDIAPAAITARVGSAPAKPLATFAPVVQPIGYWGPENAAKLPEVDLFAPDGPYGGTPSYGTWTDAQPGWTNPPYDMPIAESDACSAAPNAVATIVAGASANGTSWQADAEPNPLPGVCTALLAGGGGATLGVTVTYTVTGVGVNRAAR